MLHIYDSPELMKLANELATLDTFVDKRHAKDDFCDALRYAAIQIPWDFSKFDGDNKVIEETEDAKQLRERREHHDGKSRGPEEEAANWDIEEELNEWSSYLE